METQPWDMGPVPGCWRGKLRLRSSTREPEQGCQGTDALGSSEGMDHA